MSSPAIKTYHPGAQAELPQLIGEQKNVSAAYLNSVLESLCGQLESEKIVRHLKDKAEALLEIKRRLLSRKEKRGRNRSTWERAAEALEEGLPHKAEAVIRTAKDNCLSKARVNDDGDGSSRDKAAAYMAAADLCAECAAVAALEPGSWGRRKAADYYAEAAHLAACIDPQLAKLYRSRQAEMLQAYSHEHSELPAAMDASAILQELSRKMNREEALFFSQAWALQNLGNALLILGEEYDGARHLKKAVEAFQASSRHYDRKLSPYSWAAALTQIGNALLILGEHEEDIRCLARAAAAFRRSLQEHTRQRAPLVWAETWKNYGTALLAIGKREQGVARLKRAVSAFRTALEEITRERACLLWATVQDELGNALYLLGERLCRTEYLSEAAAAYHAALGVFSELYYPRFAAVTEEKLNTARAALNTLSFNECQPGRLLGRENGFSEEHAWRLTEPVLDAC